jgi:hypothetical protein
MAEQLQGPFEKFEDSPYSKERPSPHLHKVPTRSNNVSHPKKGSFETNITPILTTRGIKITPLPRYPHHYNLA